MYALSGEPKGEMTGRPASISSDLSQIQLIKELQNQNSGQKILISLQ